MCKIEKVLRTKRASIPALQPQKGGKPMSVNQIRYNSDMVFSVAKKLEIPLDEAIDKMVRNGGMRTLNNSYRKRKSVSSLSIVKEMCSLIG